MAAPFVALDPAALAHAVGGEGVNVDGSSSKLRIRWIDDIPIPIRTTRVTKRRTAFGACVDAGAASCEHDGGSASSIGSCKLDEIHRCWQANKP